MIIFLHYYTYNLYVENSKVIILCRQVVLQIKMHRIQLSQESLNPYNNSNANNSQLSANPNLNSGVMKKSRTKDKQKQFSKQNQSKHLNSIRPYVANTNKQKDKQRQRKISKRQSQKCISGQHNPLPNQQSSNIGNSISSGKMKNKKNSQTYLKKHSQQHSGMVIPKFLKDKQKNIQDLLAQLKTIKCQYKSLKNSYNSLLKQNNDLTQRAQRLQKQIQPAKLVKFNVGVEGQIQKKCRQFQNEIQRFKNNIVFLQKQNDRIKKQSLRMIENEKFKNKKLQQTLQQKQLMIAYLRSQLSVLNGDTSISVSHGNGFFFQNTAPTYIKPTYPNISLNQLNSNSNMQQKVGYEQNQIQVQHSSIRIIDHGSGNRQMPFIGQSITNKINRNAINQSLMSNANNSMIGDVIDLPRQINASKKNPNINLNTKINAPMNININQSSIRNINNHINENNNKRQYIFSNEDDSLSFSYEKSKSKESISMSIDQIYQHQQQMVEQNLQRNQQQNQNQYDNLSVNSIDDNPGVLTFTKKDIFILQDQQKISQKISKFQQDEQKGSKIREKNKRNNQGKDKSKNINKKSNKTNRKKQEMEHKNSIVQSEKSHVNVNGSIIGNVSVIKKEKIEIRQNEQQNKKSYNNKRAKWNSKRLQKVKYDKNLNIQSQLLENEVVSNKNQNEKKQHSSDSYPQSSKQNQQFSQEQQEEQGDQMEHHHQREASEIDEISNHHTHTNTNQQRQSYTGQQQLLTFQNRRQCIPLTQHRNTGPIFNPLNPRIKQRKNKINNIKQKAKEINAILNTLQNKQKKQMPSKSKLLTKRLQINTHDIEVNNYEGKDSSAETRKRLHQKQKQPTNSSKTGKKKLSRKRKSQQFGSKK